METAGRKIMIPTTRVSNFEKLILGGKGNTSWLDTSLPVFYVGVNYAPGRRGIDAALVESL